MKMTGAQAVIASLEAEGVELIFGYPGGQVLKLYDALYENDRICHILARHEQGAVHEADGYARATGQVGVALVTSGPGATNTVTGIATAYMDSIPLVVFTGQVPTSLIGTDCFQESDIFGITLPIVKHSYLVKNAAELPRVIKEAFYIASTGRKGPVLIDIPSDVQAQEIDFSYPDSISMVTYKPTVKGNARQVKQAARLIAAAKRPMLYVGGGTVSAGAADIVRQFSSELQIPVVHTLMGIGVVPTVDDLNIGMVGMHGSRAAKTAINESDLVIACGARFSDRVIGEPGTFAPDAKVIHIDIDPAEIDKVRHADIPIVGDIAGVLRDLLEAVHRLEMPVETHPWVSHVRELKAAYPPAVRDGSDNNGVSPAVLFKLLNERLDQDHSIVVTEVGQHQMWAAQFIERSHPRSFITSGGLGTMGFGFPASIGAQYGRPDCTVVCIAGDGSLLMNSQEMSTAAVYEVPVKVILLNNRCLGMVHQMQKYFDSGRFASTELDNNPDFLKLAAAYGWHASRVLNSSMLISGLNMMMASTGPYLLEVMVSRDVDVLPMDVPGTCGEIDVETGGYTAEDSDAIIAWIKDAPRRKKMEEWE